MWELCCHTLYPQNKASFPPPSLWKTNRGHCQNSGWGGKGCETLGNESPKYLVLLPGLSGSAPGELITKRKVSRGRVGNAANKTPHFCFCRHFVMHVINLHCGRHCHDSKWHQGWVVLALGLRTASWSSVLTSRNKFQTRVHHLLSPAEHKTDGRRTGRLKAPGRAVTGGRGSVRGTFRRAIPGELGGSLAWWRFFPPPFFFFTIQKGLWDYSLPPFHQCFFEMAALAIH